MGRYLPDMDIFSNAPRLPLPEPIHPQFLDEVASQQHLLRLEKPLRVAFEPSTLHFSIFRGVPGGGKTTLGRLADTAANRIHRLDKAVDHPIKQRLRRAVVQIIGLSPVLAAANHG